MPPKENRNKRSRTDWSGAADKACEVRASQGQAEPEACEPEHVDLDEGREEPCAEGEEDIAKEMAEEEEEEGAEEKDNSDPGAFDSEHVYLDDEETWEPIRVKDDSKLHRVITIDSDDAVKWMCIPSDVWANEVEEIYQEHVDAISDRRAGPRKVHMAAKRCKDKFYRKINNLFVRLPPRYRHPNTRQVTKSKDGRHVEDLGVSAYIRDETHEFEPQILKRIVADYFVRDERYA